MIEMLQRDLYEEVIFLRVTFIFASTEYVSIAVLIILFNILQRYIFKNLWYIVKSSLKVYT